MSDDAGPVLEVRPVLGPPDAILMASPSKSATHRAILMGARTPHAVLDNPLLSADTVASLRLAIALGARVSAEPVTDAGSRMLGRVGEGVVDLEALAPSDDLPASWQGVVLNDVLMSVAPNVPRPLLAAQVRLHVEGGDAPTQAQDVDLGNSGTTLRIGTALAAFAGAPLRFGGDASLMTRPMTPLVDALCSLGADVSAEGNDGRPPIRISGQATGTEVEIRGDVSSQYISALLIGAQGGPGLTVRVTTPLKSAPYVEITRKLVATFGGQVDVAESGSGDAGPTFVVPAGTSLSPTRYFVPGDYSSAAFPLVAAAVTGGRVSLAGMDPDSEQGDRAVLDTLAAAGCAVEWTDDPEHDDGRLLTVMAPAGPPKAFTHSFRDTPDLFPALAVLASRAAGTSTLVDAAHVRVKECDRVAAMARGLEALEVSVLEADDALTIHGLPGAPIPPALIEAHDDHRILMAFAALALAGPGPLYITDPGCYHVSYPRYRLDLDTLGGETRVVERQAAHEEIARHAPTPEDAA